MAVSLPHFQAFDAHCSCRPQRPEGGGGTPLFALYGDVPLDRIWFFGLAVLNRVCNLSWLCPKEGRNLS